MAYQTIIVEIEDYVALIRLNRPEALNALNSQLCTNWARRWPKPTATTRCAVSC